MSRAPSQVRFFKSSFEFRKWLATHHRTASELWVGYYRRSSGRPSMTWSESVGAALCFGWIDGVRKTLDEVSYTIRFSPRRARSVWSAVNIKRVRELVKQKLMRPAGLAAFKKRTAARSGVYSYERRPDGLDGVYAEELEKNQAASEFFRACPPWYRRAATSWVISAKKEETRLRRLRTLIEDSARGRTIAPLTRKKASTKSIT